MSGSNIELSTDMVQIYFSDDSPCHYINVKADSVDKIKIKGDFLMVHDITEGCWHCYNKNHITHYHFPDHVKGATKMIAEELLQEFLEASGFEKEDVEWYKHFTKICYEGKTYEGVEGLYIKLKMSSDEMTYFHHPALVRLIHED